MGLLDRFRSSASVPERTITVDRDLRRGQLMQFEGALLDLMDAIKEHRGWANPGWQARHAEYLDLVTRVQQVRPTDFDWVAVSDLAYDVRPMVKEPVPDDQALIAELQARVLRLAEALRTPRPEEIG